MFDKDNKFGFIVNNENNNNIEGLDKVKTDINNIQHRNGHEQNHPDRYRACHGQCRKHILLFLIVHQTAPYILFLMATAFSGLQYT